MALTVTIDADDLEQLVFGTAALVNIKAALSHAHNEGHDTRSDAFTVSHAKALKLLLDCRMQGDLDLGR